MLLRRLLALAYVLEYSELSWLPTEPEKVGCFKHLGIPRRKLPWRVCRVAVGKTRRDFALKPPITVEADRAVFVHVDPGHSTDQGLHSRRVASRGFRAALHKYGPAQLLRRGDGRPEAGGRAATSAGRSLLPGRDRR